MRERVRAGDALCGTGPDVRTEDVALPDGLRLRCYTPRQVRTGVVLVWFHGGGWVSGDLGYSDVFCRVLADGVGCEVRSVDYRLAPESRFPAAVEDALRAVSYSTGEGPVLVAGDSAGGNLAAVCAQQLASDRIVGQLLVYPVLDCDLTRPSYRRNDGLVLGPREMAWFWDQYAPRLADRSSPKLAPLLAATVHGTAPAVIAVAGHDPLYDEGVAYARRLREAEVAVTLLDFPGLVHGFLRLTGSVPAAATAANHVVTATASLLSGVPAGPCP